MLGLLGNSMRQSVAELWPLRFILVRSSLFLFQNKLMEFDNILYMH